MNVENKKSILLLFRENLPEEIPLEIIRDDSVFILHERQSFPEGTFPLGRAKSFEQFTGLDFIMKSIWHQVDWLKRWADIPLQDSRSFKELYQYHELPLWYFAELFLHYPKYLLRIIAAIDIFYLIAEKFNPERIVLINPRLPMACIIAKAAALKEIEVLTFKGDGSFPPGKRMRKALKDLTPRLSAHFYIAKQLLSVLFLKCARPFIKKKVLPFIYNGVEKPPEDKKRVCIVSHGSYWRQAPKNYSGPSEQIDMYWDRLIDELNAERKEKGSAITVLGVGPRAIHRRRNRLTKLREFFLPLGEDLPYVPIKWFSDFGTWNRTRKGARRILRSASAFIKNPDLADSIVYRGVNFFDEFRAELKSCFLLMLPWGIKVIEQSRSAFEKMKPHVACLYAEAGGYGRAVSFAAKLSGVKTLAIQHGLIFPHNYTYVHTQEEIEGEVGEPYPYTDRFLLYDRFVKQLLEKYGSYPPKTLEVTGGHKMDNLVALKNQVDAEQKKREIGFEERDRFAVIASRFSEIGSAFPAIVEAIEAIPRMHLIVKPHQAELPSYYSDIVEKMRAKKVRVVSNKENLFDLMLSCDLLITVNSLAAVEAMLLEKPVMVVNLPNHLSIYVDAGVAIGVKSHREILPALREMLAAAPDDLLKRQEKFSNDYKFMTDGLSGERIKAEIYALCHQAK